MGADNAVPLVNGSWNADSGLLDYRASKMRCRYMCFKVDVNLRLRLLGAVKIDAIKLEKMCQAVGSRTVPPACGGDRAVALEAAKCSEVVDEAP